EDDAAVVHRRLELTEELVEVLALVVNAGSERLQVDAYLAPHRRGERVENLVQGYRREVLRQPQRAAVGELSCLRVAAGEVDVVLADECLLTDEDGRIFVDG